MARQIKRIDIAEEDIYRGIRDSAEKTILVIERINTEFKETATVLKSSLSGAKFDNTKSLNEFTKGAEKANKLQLEAIKIEQQLERARALRATADQKLEALAQAKMRTEQQSITNAEKLARAEQKKANDTAKATKAIEDENNAYKKLSKTTTEFKNKAKTLAAEMHVLERAGQRNSKEFRDMARRLKELTAAANQGDIALKKIDKSVGDNFRNVGNYSGAVNKLRNGLGQLGLAFGIGAVVRSVGTVLQDFDEGLADIAKTTGLTIAQTRDLSTELLKIDTKTSITELQGLATAAGSLNIEGKENIIGFVKAADEAFVALGDDLGGTSQEIATSLGKIAGVFGDEKKFGVGLAITKIGSVINDLAAKSKAAAAPILDFTQRMAGLGNIISSTDAMALGAFFDEGGQSVEVASTTLNTLLPKLAKNYKEFAVTAGMTAEEFKKLAEKSPVEALKAVAIGAKNSEKGLFNLSKTVESFGVDSARATSIVGFLANNTERLTELQKIGNEANKEATSLSKEAALKNATFSASVDKLTNAWHNWIISTDSAVGATSIFSKILGFLANNLGTILGYVGKAIVAFGAYQAILLAVKAKQMLFNGGLKDTAKGMLDVFRSTKQAGEGAKLAGENVSKAGKLMSAVPWMLIIGLAVELAMGLYDIASGAKQAREDLAKLQKQSKISLEQAGSNVVEIQENLNKLIKKYNDELKLGEISQIKFNELQLEAQNNAVDQLNMNKKLAYQRFLEYKKDKETLIELKTLRDLMNDEDYSYSMSDKEKERRLEAELKLLEKKYKSTSLTTGGAIDEIVGTLNANIGGTTARIGEYSKAIKELGEDSSDTAVEIKVLENEQEEATKTTVNQTKAVKELNTEMKEHNEYLSEQNDLLQKINEQKTARDVRGVQTDIDTVLSNDLKKANETGVVDVDLLEILIEEKYQLEKAGIEAVQKFKLEKLLQGYILETENAKKNILAERDELLSQKGLSIDEIARIEANYQTAKEQIENDNRQRLGDFELQKRILTEETNVEIIDLEKAKFDEINDINDQLIAGQEAYSDAQIKTAETTTDAVVKNFDKQRELVRLSADYFIKRSEDKIDQIDKEIAASEKQFDALQQMAINGNINAAESLAEQQKIINEANLRKQKEQQRIERIKMAEAVYSGYTANVEKGEKNPLAKTITDITLLRQFVASLPTFYEGTETTVSDALGTPQMSGRDGHIVRVDGSEKILNPTLSKMTGGMTTSEIARVSQEYLTGKLINSGSGAVQINAPWSNYEMLSKMDEMTNAIKNMPENSYELGQVTQESFMLMQRKSKGNTTTYNRYKVK